MKYCKCGAAIFTDDDLCEACRDIEEGEEDKLTQDFKNIEVNKIKGE